MPNINAHTIRILIIRIYTYNLYNPLISKNTHAYMYPFCVIVVDNPYLCSSSSTPHQLTMFVGENQVFPLVFFTTRALTIWRSNLLGLKRFCGLRAWHGRGALGIGLNMIQWVSMIFYDAILYNFNTTKDHQNQGFIAQTTNNKGFAAKFRI